MGLNPDAHKRAEVRSRGPNILTCPDGMQSLSFLWGPSVPMVVVVARAHDLCVDGEWHSNDGETRSTVVLTLDGHSEVEGDLSVVGQPPPLLSSGDR